MNKLERLRREAGHSREAYLACERELARRGQLSQRKVAFFSRKKVSVTIADAWFRGTARKLSNSETDGETLYLFDNAIAWWNEDGASFTVTTAGHPGFTTRERLNALPGVRCYQSKGVVYLNGSEWDGQPTTIKLAI